MLSIRERVDQKLGGGLVGQADVSLGHVRRPHVDLANFAHARLNPTAMADTAQRARRNGSVLCARAGEAASTNGPACVLQCEGRRDATEAREVWY